MGLVRLTISWRNTLRDHRLATKKQEEMVSFSFT